MLYLENPQGKPPGKTSRENLQGKPPGKTSRENPQEKSWTLRVLNASIQSHEDLGGLR
jgi:hypothetical protein